MLSKTQPPNCISFAPKFYPHFSGDAERKVTETAAPPANLVPPWNMALLINILNCSIFKRSFCLPFTIQGFYITYSHKSVMSLQSLFENGKTYTVPCIFFFSNPHITSIWVGFHVVAPFNHHIKTEWLHFPSSSLRCCFCPTLKRM